jgi:hypothetical protein
MFIVIKSPPGSPEASAAVKKAAELATDIVLTEEAVGLALKDRLEGFCGTAFALEDDVLLHLPEGAEMEKGVKLVSREELESMLAGGGYSGPY